MLRRIYIRLGSPETLRRDAERWLGLLLSNDCLKHVRRLEIEGCLAFASSDQYAGRYEPWLKDYDQTDVLAEPPPRPGDYIYRESRTAVQHHDYVWEPLARLIRQLPRLRDLVYAAANTFSPVLLETLHVYKADCHLHMPNFLLHTLERPHFVDPLEMRLLTSPCLHSIWLHYQRYGQTDSQMLAAMQMASGLAPNLKEIAVSVQPAAGELRDWAAEHREPVWEGFPDVGEPSVLRRGSLTSLDLRRRASVDLERWSKYSDLSMLRTLKVLADFDFFKWTASHSDFRSLTTLVLDVDLGRYWESLTDPNLDIVMTFFRAIPPLKNLVMDSDVALQCLDAILKQHGSSLRRLWFPYQGRRREHPRTRPTADEIQRVIRLCPSMEDLMITVPRSKGDRDEIALYRSIGRHSRLRQVTLYLDCDCTDPGTEMDSVDSVSSSEEEYYGSLICDQSGTRLRGEAVQSALINSAVDEHLAESIFREIRRSRPAGAITLQKLELHVAGGLTAFGYNDGTYEDFTNNLLRVLGRSWVCEQHPRDDMQDQILTKELGQLAREQAEKDIGSKLWEYETVVRRIWPKGEDDDWRKDWRSFSLRDADYSVSAWIEAQRQSK
ncbi:hypothetical protein LTR17_011317 [Elasticomyces elasticus]|nr:hypothetical protein LTR17_011317 [Elasticomyces elasticus]